MVLPVQLKIEDSKNAPKERCRNSNEFFSQSLPNVILDMVREFSDLNRVSSGSDITSRPKDYLKEDRRIFWQKLTKLCDGVERV